MIDDALRASGPSVPAAVNPPSALPKALSTGMGSPIPAAPKAAPVPAADAGITAQQGIVNNAQSEAQKAESDLAYAQQEDKVATEKGKQRLQSNLQIRSANVLIKPKKIWVRRILSRLLKRMARAF